MTKQERWNIIILVIFQKGGVVMAQKNNVPSRGNNISMQKYVSSLMEQLPQWDDMQTSTDEARGFATISGKRDGMRFSLTIDKSELGETRTQSVYTELSRKSDYKDEVHRLRQQGLKQREIALRLGISQSLVSKLLND